MWLLRYLTAVSMSIGLSLSVCCVVFRAPLVSPASRVPQDLLVSLGSCRGWDRRVRMGTRESRDHQVSRGQTDVEELQDRKVLWDRKETMWVSDKLSILSGCTETVCPVQTGSEGRSTKNSEAQRKQGSCGRDCQDCWLCANWIHVSSISVFRNTCDVRCKTFDVTENIK